jgi:hypothetical protein
MVSVTRDFAGDNGALPDPFSISFSRFKSTTFSWRDAHEPLRQRDRA